MRRNLTILFLVTALCGLCTYAALVQREQQTVAERLIRLHIVANSDDPADQDLKLQVRDELLPVIERLTADCGSREEAEAALRAHLSELKACAQQTLSSLGSRQSVTVSLGTELFPRRDYDTFSLPAGQYRTLRLTLGSGEGHNWWCVAFPSLCLPATSEEWITAAQESGMSAEQTDLLTGKDVTVELKFKLLDWLQRLFG